MERTTNTARRSLGDGALRLTTPIAIWRAATVHQSVSVCVDREGGKRRTIGDEGAAALGVAARLDSLADLVVPRAVVGVLHGEGGAESKTGHEADRWFVAVDARLLYAALGHRLSGLADMVVPRAIVGVLHAGGGGGQSQRRGMEDHS
jgi:hypothetical protein